MERLQEDACHALRNLATRNGHGDVSYATRESVLAMIDATRLFRSNATIASHMT
eukprot:gene8593-4479_t